MITREQVDQLEKLMGQLDSLHAELSALSRKSPNDAVNAFKMRFVNRVLKECNDFLGPKYTPFADFQEFNLDEVPSNSDVTFMVSQYMQAAEKFRSDHIEMDLGTWYYDLPEDARSVSAAEPAKLRK